jgi:type IV secretion system protein VirB1
MKMKTVLMISTVLLGWRAEAVTNETIVQSILRVSQQSGVPAKMYYTFIDIESGFVPYTIATTTTVENATLLEKILPKQFNVRNRPYGSKKRLVSIVAKKHDDIVALAKVMIKNGYSIDMGLMQINSRNVKAEEVDHIFEPYNNIAHGSNIIAECSRRYSGVHDAIECYNKGYRKKKNYDYFHKFLISYNQNFGGKK